MKKETVLNSPSKMSVTPPRVLSVSPSARTDDKSSSRDGDVNDLESSDDESISLEELMSERNGTLANVVSDRTDNHADDQSSTACIPSLNSSRETIETSTTARIPISPHELASRCIKAQQRAAMRTQAQKTQQRRRLKEDGVEPSSSLEAYLQKTRPDVQETRLEESNGTLVTGLLRRSTSEKSLLEMEKESVTGKMFVLRRRSNSFNALHTTTSLPTFTHILDAGNASGQGEVALFLDDDEEEEHEPLPLAKATRKTTESRVYDDEEQEDGKDEEEESLSPARMNRDTIASQTLKRYCGIVDGCSDEDAYVRRARGRRLARQQSVRDATAGRATRTKEIRRRMLRKERSVNQIKKADDFLQAKPSDSLKGLVDALKDEEKEQEEESIGNLRRHLTTIQSSKPRDQKYSRSQRQPSRLRGDGSRAHVHASPSTSLTSQGTSETSMISSDCSDLFVTSSKAAQSSRHEKIDCNDPYSGLFTAKCGEDRRRSPSEDASASSDSWVDRSDSSSQESDVPDYEEPSVILQFDTSQEGNVSRVRLGMENWCLVQIPCNCQEGSLMIEGRICRLPEIASVWQEARNSDSSGKRAANSKMLWRGPSSFFDRRNKSKVETGTVLPNDEQSQFDDLGRIVIPD